MGIGVSVGVTIAPAFVAAGTGMDGPVLGRLLLGLLLGLLVAFVAFSLSGILVQGWLLHLEIAEDSEPTTPWNTPSSREGWEPPEI